jgi:hypothetical protein
MSDIPGLQVSVVKGDQAVTLTAPTHSHVIYGNVTHYVVMPDPTCEAYTHIGDSQYWLLIGSDDTSMLSKKAMDALVAAYWELPENDEDNDEWCDRDEQEHSEAFLVHARHHGYTAQLAERLVCAQ